MKRRVGNGIGLLFLVLLVLLPGHRRGDLGAQASDPCAATPVNPVACENSKPGNPQSEWDVSGAGSTLPHFDRIQQAFGSHDVGEVRAHVGGQAAAASEQMGAEAYATGNQIAFSSPRPD
jgi:hypothetical protein